MGNRIFADVKGWPLLLCECEPWQRTGREKGDLWVISDGEWDGPNDPLPISEWPDRIDKWEVEKQKAAGVSVWVIDHDNPKYWGQRDAVFRTGRPKDHPQHYRDSTHMVHMRNGKSPDSLYPQPRGYVALNTPEVVAAIEAARQAHAEAVQAAKRFRAAKNAIPTMTEEEWLRLPPKPGSEEAT